MKIIECMDLNKSFKKNKALNNFNFNLYDHDIYGLVGPNGAGKSTFLKIIAGHSIKDSGQVSIFEKNLDNLGNKKAGIGFLIEKPAFYSYMTGKEALKYIADLKKIKFSLDDEIIDEFNMREHLNRKIKSYSTGMRMRLGIIAACIGKPRILILDEPINGLDPEGIIELRNFLKRINKEWNTSIIVSSHILSELSLITNRIGFIKNGLMVEEISKEELDEKTQNYIQVTSKEEDLAQVVNTIENDLKINNYKVLADNVVRVFDDFDMFNFQKILVGNGIYLMGISRERLSLEDYYISLVGEEKWDMLF